MSSHQCLDLYLSVLTLAAYIHIVFLVYLASQGSSGAVGFNAPVAGTFFAVETVLKPQHSENSPPLTTAMIILAAVISSTVSEILLGEKPAFTVPPYELRSATGMMLRKHNSILLNPFL